MGRETPPDCPSRWTAREHQLAGYLSRAQLVRDDAGQHAPHVPSFHGGAEQRNCHFSDFLLELYARGRSLGCIGRRRPRFVNNAGWRFDLDDRAGGRKSTRADQGNEPTADGLFDAERAPGPSHQHHHLGPSPVSDRHHEDPVVRKLVPEDRGNGGGRRADQDPVEGRLLGPTRAPVSDADGDVAVAEVRDGVERGSRELGYPLHRENLSAELRKHRGLVPAARADLEHPLGPAQRQRLGHEANHVGLGDGLVMTDGQGTVLIGLGPGPRGNEGLPRHPAHGVQHPVVNDVPGPELQPDHPFGGGDGRMLCRHGKPLI